jgi:glucosamine-phosphate N-acetyltransferase
VRRADEEKGRIIAAGTLLLEHKFIRGCGTAGHIEDVVVDSSYRGLRLGAR